jgi:hypothetical protein
MGIGEMGMEQKDKSESGATRNSIPFYRFDLLVFAFLAEMAAVMAEGVLSHGEENWKGGFDNEGRDIVNHIWNHWRQYLDGDRTERHLAKMAIGLMFLWYFERERQQENADHDIK